MQVHIQIFIQINIFYTFAILCTCFYYTWGDKSSLLILIWIYITTEGKYQEQPKWKTQWHTQTIKQKKWQTPAQTMSQSYKHRHSTKPHNVAYIQLYIVHGKKCMTLSVSVCNSVFVIVCFSLWVCQCVCVILFVCKYVRKCVYVCTCMAVSLCVYVTVGLS